MKLPFEVDEYPWQDLQAYSGDASHIPKSLLKLSKATSESEAQDVYWEIDSEVVAQGVLYEAAPATAACLIALLPRSKSFSRLAILELLFQLGNGEYVPDGSRRGSIDLEEDCMREVLRGEVFYIDLLERGDVQEIFFSLDLLCICSAKDSVIADRFIRTIDKLMARNLSDRLMQALTSSRKEAKSYLNAN